MNIVETSTDRQAAKLEASLRRKAKRLGYRITKVRENSRWFGQYGPFMVSDGTTDFALQYGLTLDEARSWLES